jgi:PKD repeat protein
VVDAVDDEHGNRWVSADTGTSTVTVEVGDTVEWQFDSAVIDHDLTSDDSRTIWVPPVQEYRRPDDPPVRYTFTQPGTYLYLCSVHGTVMRGTVEVVEPGADDQLPEIAATATPSSGGAPARVAFSTEVTTTGAFAAFADGLATHPDLAGTAELVRARSETRAAIDVTGLAPAAHHMVHVHEQPCDQANGGAHFRFDEALPFGPENEIWLPFTSDGEGSSGPVAVARPQRAGPKAVSVVVHDHANPALRVGCADLVPATAELAYAWDFGDGTTGTGADIRHPYSEAGIYTATVTVTWAGDASGAAVRDSVEVVVTDDTAPVVRRIRPTGVVRDRTPTVRATVRDRHSAVRRRDLVMRIDGRRVDVRYDARRGVLSWTPQRALSRGRHVVRLAVADTAGNRRVVTWRFRVRH